MQYFEENKISVFTTQTTMKVGEKFNISLRISNDFGFVNEARIIMNQQGGTNEKNLKAICSVCACNVWLTSIGSNLCVYAGGGGN